LEDIGGKQSEFGRKNGQRACNWKGKACERQYHAIPQGVAGNSYELEELPSTATLTATHGEQPWTVANNHELSIILNSASMDVGGRWWT
jgi:hypothetical protein